MGRYRGLYDDRVLTGSDYVPAFFCRYNAKPLGPAPPLRRKHQCPRPRPRLVVQKTEKERREWMLKAYESIKKSLIEAREAREAKKPNFTKDDDSEVPMEKPKVTKDDSETPKTTKRMKMSSATPSPNSTSRRQFPCPMYNRKLKSEEGVASHSKDKHGTVAKSEEAISN